MFNQRLFNSVCLAVVVLPLAGFFAAVAIALDQGKVGALELTVCAVMFVLTFLGIEVGYHRHFAHCSFCTSRPVRHVLGALGSMACQGTVIWWAGVHRTHHHFSDRDGDPHSPLNGLVRAHMTWLMDGSVNPDGWTRRVKDLIHDPVAAAVHRRYPYYAIAGLMLPALLVAAAEGSWQGLLSGLLWGGLVRIFLVNHIVWSINSICHCFGSTPYPTQDMSRNNYWLMLPSMGFSLHNNHHAFPRSAMTSHAWWQLDLCGLVIRLMAACGLVWNLRVPSPEQRARRKNPRRRAIDARAASAPLAAPDDLREPMPVEQTAERTVH